MKRFSCFLPILLVMGLLFCISACNEPESTLDITPPAEVSFLSVNVEYWGISISWVNPTDEDFAGLKIEITDSNDFYLEVYPSVDRTSYDYYQLPVGTYVIRVLTYDYSENYSSGEFSIVTIEDKFSDTTPPAEVSFLSVNVEYWGISISWVNPTDEDFAGLKIEITDSNDFYLEVYPSVDRTSYDYYQLPVGTYVIRVLTYDYSYNYSSGESSIVTIEDNFSDDTNNDNSSDDGNISDDTENDDVSDSGDKENSQPDTVPPAQVENLIVDYSADENTITVSWTNPADEDFAGVEIVYGKLGFSETARLYFDESISSTIITEIADDDSEYFIYVKSKDTTGNFSEVVSTTVIAIKKAPTVNSSEFKNKLISNAWVNKYSTGNLWLSFSSFNVNMKEYISLNQTSIERTGFWTYEKGILSMNDCGGFSGDYKATLDEDTLTLISVNDETVVYIFTKDYTNEILDILLDNAFYYTVLSDSMEESVRLNFSEFEQEVYLSVLYDWNDGLNVSKVERTGHWSYDYATGILTLTDTNKVDGDFTVNFNPETYTLSFTYLYNESIVFTMK